MNKKNKNLLLNFAAIVVLSFLMIFFGLKIAAGSALSLQNTAMLLGFCLLVGFVSSVFYQFNLKAAWIIFNIGVAVGLLNMLYTFFRDLSGWEDLAALAALFVWIAIGLGAGLVIQLIIFLLQKSKRKK